ncbi:MAG TPA: hypothetical protein PLD66_10515 [Accumulibacter sp.]|nr:hypothetical protein [Accumulibacter sp.]
MPLIEVMKASGPQPASKQRIGTEKGDMLKIPENSVLNLAGNRLSERSGCGRKAVSMDFSLGDDTRKSFPKWTVAANVGSPIIIFLSRRTRS